MGENKNNLKIDVHCF